ncbi:hypothetical protein ABIA18_003416 [Sinorhizobium fredii]
MENLQIVRRFINRWKRGEDKTELKRLPNARAEN